MESRLFGHKRIWGWIVVCMVVIGIVGFAATGGATGRQETATAKTGASKYAGQTLTLLMWGSGWDEAMQASAAEFEKQFGVKIRNESQESTSDGLIKLPPPTSCIAPNPVSLRTSTSPTSRTRKTCGRTRSGRTTSLATSIPSASPTGRTSSPSRSRSGRISGTRP
jgi:hypothetical protein